MYNRIVSMLISNRNYNAAVRQIISELFPYVIQSLDIHTLPYRSMEGWLDLVKVVQLELDANRSSC